MTVLCLYGCLWPAWAMPASANTMITADEWTVYKERFVAEDGRVIDDANDGISHSEGQGYGLILAYLAGSRPDFERIWTFTRNELMLRDDGLSAWKWDPDASPHIIDANNASDGDILIAYALALAGESWDEDRMIASARTIAAALARTSVYEQNGHILLRPGVDGFGADDREDGPVVNLSYWIFEAFPVFQDLAPEADWAGLAGSGLELLTEAEFGERHLPPEWLAMNGAPQPAAGFSAEFGYNALRIPLYLMRANEVDDDLLRRLAQGMEGEEGGVVVVDLEDGRIRDELMDPGYRIIPAMVRCALDDQTLDAELSSFEPTVYYPSTLQLLALAHLREHRPECL